MLPCYILFLISWAGAESRTERKGEGRDGAVQERTGGARIQPQELLSRLIKFLPFSLLWACPEPAVGIMLVYTAHYAGFAVAIATTRGQFIEGEEVHFGGVSFPASVQSTAENKRPRH